MPQSEVNSLRVNTFPEDMEEETVDENSSLLPNHQHHLDNLDVDKLLVERVGEFGKYQKFIYVLVCLPAALTAGITLGSVFTEFVPVHRCFVPGSELVTGFFGHFMEWMLLWSLTSSPKLSYSKFLALFIVQFWLTM